MIARVVVEKGPPGHKTFDYAVPEALQGRIGPGVRVTIPFGARVARGTVIDVREHSEHPNLRELITVSENRDSTLTPALLRLAHWMADYYCAPLSAVCRSMLPAPVRRADEARRATRLFVVPAAAGATDALTRRQLDVLAAVRHLNGGWLSEVVRKLCVSTALLRKLESAGFLRIETRHLQRDPLANRKVLPSRPPVLMAEQIEALAVIRAACGAKPDDRRPALLFGVTGSGKTEIYLQAIASVLERRHGAIVLVPEIALTPQTVQRFIARFGDTVAVLHSALRGGDRQQAWRRIHAGLARVVIGPRSAVFAPVAPLGLIVVDEEHEPSYKQDEAPRYHARDVAVMRAHLEGCAVVLGSATPALESWRNAQCGKYRLVKLTRRVDNRNMPKVQIVDMRGEMARTGRMPVFSQMLVEAVTARLARGEQTMLFLNRRGFSASLMCLKCGHVSVCDDCSVSHTYHRHDERLRCHVCGASAPVPAACPQCGDKGFRFAGVGTQRIEHIAARLFPKARIQRMDADVTSRRGSHEQILAAFRSHAVDILIGTQMIAKGLDFPNVTLVGVLMADLSLHMPDFRAGERTFQLLAQVAGRSGRGVVPGEVIVQTFTPRHRAVLAARDNNFEGFAAGELSDRRELGYPPFRRLVCMTFRGEKEGAVEDSAQRVQRDLSTALGTDVSVSEPVPAPLARAKKHFRFQILLRGPSAKRMTDAIRTALDRFPPSAGVQAAVDIDAINLM